MEIQDTIGANLTVYINQQQGADIQNSGLNGG